VQNGVVEYCQRNDILVTAYSPIKFRAVGTNSTIAEVASAHSATPFQIALAWLVMQPRVITIPMSYNPQHIKENFQAAEMELTREEFDALSKAW
jgi:diketogulonate reductase-like aldo/keto reductase